MATRELSDDEGGRHPWDDDRKRMRDELVAQSYGLTDRLRGRLPAPFETKHGLFVQKTIRELVAGIDSPEELVLSSMPGALTASTDPSPATTSLSSRDRRSDEQIAASLRLVQEERDRLVTTNALATKTISSLRADLARAQGPAIAVPSASLPEIEKLKERIFGLEKQLVDEQQQHHATATALSEYQEFGAADLFAAYTKLGTVDEIGRRERSLQSLARLALVHVSSSDRAAVAYEAFFPRVLLGYLRRGEVIKAIYRSLSSRLPTGQASLAAQLAAIAPEIVDTPAAELSVALGQLATSTNDASTTADPALAAVPSHDEIASLSLDARVVTDDLHRLLLGPRGLDQLKEEVTAIVSAEHGDDPVRRGSRRPRLYVESDDEQQEADETTSCTGDLKSARDSDLVDLTTRGDGDDDSDGSWKKVPLAKLPRGVVNDRPSHLTKDAFAQLRVNFRAAHRVAVSCRSARAWPVGPPPKALRPDTIRQVRMTPWRFDWFVGEQLAPTTAEYSQCVGDRQNQRFVTLEEATELYASEPWKALARPPPPVTFDPTDPRFRNVYSNARRVYDLSAQVLWERTHFLLLKPPRPGVKAADRNAEEKECDAWVRRRRRRNSDFTARWTAHLVLIRDLLTTGTVDADFLLDPFLYWPPVSGVMVVVPFVDQSLRVCIESLDRAQPERLYFATSDTADLHVVYQTSVGGRKEADAVGARVFDRISAKFVLEDAGTQGDDDASASASGLSPTSHKTRKRTGAEARGRSRSRSVTGDDDQSPKTRKRTGEGARGRSRSRSVTGDDHQSPKTRKRTGEEARGRSRSRSVTGDDDQSPPPKRASRPETASPMDTTSTQSVTLPSSLSPQVE